MKWASLLLLAAIPVLATDSNFETGSLVNGRGWASMNRDMKVSYLHAVYDCAQVAPMFTPGSKQGSGIMSTIDMEGTTFDETSKAIDSFYGESMNGRVPIIFALQWVRMKHDGASTTALEQKAATFRSFFNAVKTTPPQ